MKNYLNLNQLNQCKRYLLVSYILLFVNLIACSNYEKDYAPYLFYPLQQKKNIIVISNIDDLLTVKYGVMITMCEHRIFGAQLEKLAMEIISKNLTAKKISFMHWNNRKIDITSLYKGSSVDDATTQQLVSLIQGKKSDYILLVQGFAIIQASLLDATPVMYRVNMYLLKANDPTHFLVSAEYVAKEKQYFMADNVVLAKHYENAIHQRSQLPAILRQLVTEAITNAMQDIQKETAFG